MTLPRSDKGHLRLPNWLVERLARLHLRPTQWQVLWAVWRKTLCWQEGGHWQNRSYPISRLDLATATGLDEGQVKRDLKQLVKMNIILRENIPGGRSHKPVTAFNLDPSTWKIKGGIIDPLSNEVKGGGVTPLSDRFCPPLGPVLPPFTTENAPLYEPNSGTGKKDLKKTTKEASKQRVFDLWNSLNVIQHKKLTDKRSRAILTALQHHTLEEICQAVMNYAKAQHGEEYFWDWRWTLEDFINRGLERFIGEEEDVLTNYLKDKGEKNGQSTQRRGGPMGGGSGAPRPYTREEAETAGWTVIISGEGSEPED